MVYRISFTGIAIIFYLLSLGNIALADGKGELLKNVSVDKDEAKISSDGKNLFTGEPYRIGCVFAITGRASFLGISQRNAVVMLAERINKAGGVDGHQIELIIENTMGNSETMRSAVRKLINKDNVLAIIGPSRSGCAIGAIDRVQDKGIVMVSCAAAESIVTPVMKRKWIFKVSNSDRDVVRRLLEFIKKAEIKKIGFLSDSTGFGRAGREAVKKLAREYGLDIVADESFDPASNDLTTELKKIKKAGAEALLVWSILPAQALVAKQMKQVNLEVPLFQSHGYGNIKYVQAGGKNASGTVFPGAAILVADDLPANCPQREIVRGYKKEYETRYDETAEVFGAYAYDALGIVIKALDEVGPDRAKIRDYLETMNGDNSYQGVTGSYNITGQDHCGLDKDDLEMIVVKDGKFQLYK